MCWLTLTNRVWKLWVAVPACYALNPHPTNRKTRTMTVYGLPIVTEWVPSLVRAAAHIHFLRARSCDPAFLCFGCPIVVAASFKVGDMATVELHHAVL